MCFLRAENHRSLSSHLQSQKPETWVSEGWFLPGSVSGVGVVLGLCTTHSGFCSGLSWPSSCEPVSPCPLSLIS